MGEVAGVQFLFQFFDGVNLRQVTLVVLQDHRQGVEGETVLLQILFKVFQALDVFIHLAAFGIGHEDDTICSLKNQFAGRVVIDLTGNGIDLELGLHASDLSQIEGQEVEEEGAIPLGGDTGEVTHTGLGCLLMNHFQVGGLATQSRTVVDDLAVHFLEREVDLNHVCSCFRGPASFQEA